MLQIQQRTYSNPLNLDYGYTPFPDFGKWGRHRDTAEPVIAGEYMDDAFFEGAWMTKHNSQYYFQYVTPGTEFSGRLY